MDYHHLLEGAGTVASGILLCSLASVWFAPEDPRRRPPWIALMGLMWGGLAVILMISRIQTLEGIFVDGRLIPIAIIGLFVINNPLAIIMGCLQMLEDRLPPGTEESGWTRTGRNAAVRIRDALGRLGRIVRLESTHPSGAAPPILDLERSITKRPDDAGR